MVRVKEPRFVTCLWDDAAFTGGAFDADEIDPLVRIRTTGHLVTKTKKHVVIAQDWLETPGCATGAPDYRHISTIPRGMVVKLTYLKARGK